MIHLVALGLASARYGEIGFMFQNVAFAGPGQLPAGYGYELPVVYLVWCSVVVTLYPACRWFSGLKSRQRAAWLRYL